MTEAKFLSELEYDGTGRRPTLRPYVCGRCLCDCCGCEKVRGDNSKSVIVGIFVVRQGEIIPKLLEFEYLGTTVKSVLTKH